MKILQWAFPYLPVHGGREVFVQNISAELVRSAHDVIVFAQASLPEDPVYVLDTTDANFPVHRFNLEKLTGPDGAQALKDVSSIMERIALDFAPDIIHFHNIAGRDTLFLKAVKAVTGAKVVLTLHLAVDNPSPVFLALLKAPLDLTDAFVAISHFVFDDFVQHFPARRGDSYLVLNGVPRTPHSPEPAEGILQVFASGRLSPEKGFPVLLSAFSILLTRIGKARLTIAGEGTERIALERYIRHLEIEDSVELLGWCSAADVRRHQDASHFVVVPSIWEEPFGLVAAEALMAGRAVIASRTGGLPELVQHRKNGMLCRPGDIFDLSATMFYLATDPAATSALGHQGRRDALERFSLDACVTGYTALFQELISA